MNASAVGERPPKVIGVGNRWRGDDAAGLVAAQRLRESPAGADVLELEGEPVALLDAWEGEGRVIVIDAVVSGSEPGTVHRIDAIEDELPDFMRRTSTHALGLAEAVELGRALDRLPGGLIVLGIEGSSFEAGDALTPGAERGVAAAVERAAAELAGFETRPR
jgi:hydrogenase maturation protease